MNGTYRFRPIDKPLVDWLGEDLAALRKVGEGWYVDYKRDAIDCAAFAKHLSAFANQYGGWLFLGIDESRDSDRVAASFPGIESAQVNRIVEVLGAAANHHVSPPVHFEHKAINGPVEAIGLPADRAVLVIGTPEGLRPPYVHSSGRIYRRLADRSEPKPETDQAALVHLWRRRERATSRLTDFVSRTPRLSESETGNAWVHVFLLADPLFERRTPGLTFDDFRTALTDAEQAGGVGLPMDTFFSTADGFVARQERGNDPALYTLTLRWWHDENLRASIPINVLPLTEFEQSSSRYEHANEYSRVVRERGFSEIRVADLSIFVHALAGVLHCYAHLLSGIDGGRDVSACAVIQHALRISPFIDDAAFVEDMRTLGVPVVEEEEIRVPRYVDFSSLLRIHMQPTPTEPIPKPFHSYLTCAPIAGAVLQALGALSSPDYIKKYRTLYDPETLSGPGTT